MNEDEVIFNCISLFEGVKCATAVFLCSVMVRFYVVLKLLQIELCLESSDLHLQHAHEELVSLFWKKSMPFLMIPRSVAFSTVEGFLKFYFR